MSQSKSTMTAWYVSRGGGGSGSSVTMGPFATDMIRSMLRDGQLQALDLVYREGEVEWKPAASFKELKAVHNVDAEDHRSSDVKPPVLPSKGESAVRSTASGAMSWIVLRPHSGTYLQEGPFETQTIIDGLQAGRFQFSQYAWHIGMSQWMRIGDLREFDRRSRSRESKPHVPPPLPDPIAAVLLEDDKDMEAEEFHVSMKGMAKLDLTPNPLESLKSMGVGIGGAAAESPEVRLASSAVNSPNLAAVPWESEGFDEGAQSVELIDDERSGFSFVSSQLAEDSIVAPIEKTPLPLVSPPASPGVAVPLKDNWIKWGRTASGVGLFFVFVLFAVDLVTGELKSENREAVVVAPPVVLPETKESEPAASSASEVPAESLPPLPVAATPRTEFSIVGLHLDGSDPQLALQGVLPSNSAISVAIKGRLGQVLSKLSVRKEIKLVRKDGEIPTVRLRDLKLPSGAYTVEVDVDGTKVRNEIFLGRRDAKFLGLLESHLREISLETQAQKKALFYAAKELDTLARDLGENYGSLRSKPQMWQAYFSSWTKKLDSIKRSVGSLKAKSPEDLAYPDETAALGLALSGLVSLSSQYHEAIVQKRDLASDTLTELIAELSRQKAAIGDVTARPTADTPDGLL